MKSFDVKEHTNKYMKFAKAAGKGTYPDKKTVKMGSEIGLGVGGVLFCAGIYGLTQSAVWGIWSLVAGILTILSNMITLIRTKST